jgi:cation transport protein ChaC
VDFWVFGYGSLMWRPHFPIAESAPAFLEGAHRALCVYSTVHRGTTYAPGLVLGLDRGGKCQGMAFRVAKPFEQDTRVYLRRRENISNTYAALVKEVALQDGRTVPALCYFVNRYTPQYAGDLPLQRQAYLVRRSIGASGPNIDYVINTVSHLRDVGVFDERLERLMTVLGHGRFK